MKNEPTEFEIALEQQPTAGLWPQPKDAALELLDRLESIGVRIPDESAALNLIEQAMDSAGDLRGAEAIGFIFANLPGGKIGTLLRQALLGTLGDGAKSAQKFGITKQIWCMSVRRLRDRIFKTTYSVPTYKACADK